MIRTLEFTAANRTREVAAHYGNLLSSLENDPEKARELRGTIAITFPDEEFPGNASPLVDSRVQQFLKELFDASPDLLYYLADFEEAGSLLLVASAFTPVDLVAQPDGRVALRLSPEWLGAVAQLLVNAASLAVSVGQDRELVLTHVRNTPPEVRTAIRDTIIASVAPS